jgi:hypothetical protein
MRHFIDLFILGMLTLVSFGCNKIIFSDLSANGLDVSSPLQMRAGECSPWTISLKRGSSSAKAKSLTVVNLSLTSSGSAVSSSIFSDAACSTSITSATFSEGQSSLTVYVKHNWVQAIELTATTSGLAGDVAAVTTSQSFSKVDWIAGGFDPGGNSDQVGEKARLSGPSGIATDGTYVYVALYARHQILRTHIATRQQTRLAGTWNKAGNVDGVGLNAQFSSPYGMTLLNNQLYVADAGTNTIRKIDLGTNMVTTIAGTAGVAGSTDGIGTAAQFAFPTGLANDGTYVYIADASNETIRRLDPSTNTVITIAGSAGAGGGATGIGAIARFNTPLYLDCDGSYLYIANYNGHDIRRLDLSNNNVEVLAGSYGVIGSADGTGVAANFNLPTTAIYDAGFLYIADRGNQTIRKLDLSDNSVTTIIGSPGVAGHVEGPFATARVKQPTNLVKVGTHIYGTSETNHLVYDFDLTGETMSTLVGVYMADAWSSVDGTGATVRFDWVDQMTADENDLYISDCSGNTIRKQNIASGLVTTIAGTTDVAGSADGTGTLATLNCPEGIVKSGNFLYWGDGGGQIIRKMDLVSGAVSTIAGQTGVSGGADGTGALATFHTPEGMTILGDDLFVFDFNGRTVRKVNASTGVVTTIAGAYGVAGTTDDNGTSARFGGPIAGSVLHGLLYIVDYTNNCIRKMDLTTSDVTTFAGSCGVRGYADGLGAAALFNDPYSITNDGTSLYVTDGNNNSIRKIDPLTGEVTTLIGNPYYQGDSFDVPLAKAALNYPTGIAWTTSGLFYANLGLNINYVH